MGADFAGYATKAGLKCSDGRTITPDAFKHQDKITVPLVWQHGHSDPKNVLGHMELEARDDGIYGYGFFNDTEQGQNAKQLVAHKDVTKLSIYAGSLVEKMMSGAKTVLHGAIQEVSLVLAGANPGATIDYVRIAHADGTISVMDDPNDAEAIITTGLDIDVLSHVDESEEVVEHAAASGSDSDKTLQDIYDSMTQEQKDVCNYMVGAALEEASTGGGAVKHTALEDGVTPQDVYDDFSDDQKAVVHSMIDEAVEEANTTAVHSANDDKEGIIVTNVFEDQAQSAAVLSHAARKEARKKITPEVIKSLMDEAKINGSFGQAFLAHAGDYGIDDIDLLFPDATLDQNGISIISRRMEWVNSVLSGTRHSPFSRVKSLAADITADEARARGYVKATRKKEEVIKLLKRVTGPKTIYKKQKLDRDDILDITDLDIVAWLKAEMRIMLDEEVARAVLIGDGRDPSDDDKIDEDSIRPIAFDDDMYTTAVNLPVNATPSDLIDAVVGALDGYKGTGTPTLYTTQRKLTQMLLGKDTLGRRLYATKSDLANALLVADIVPVEAMEQETDLVGVIVNLGDYTIGTDAGGQVSMFDDFDIDFNQQKYLIETRLSGALTKPKSAIALFINSGKIVSPTAPTFVASTGVLTIPTQTGVTWVNSNTNTTLTPGAQTAIAPSATIEVEAVPADGYGLTHGVEHEYAFTRNAS